MSLSIILLTGNEEKIISNAVNSVSKWCDELVLVCANSKDKSEDIVRIAYPKVKVININDDYGKNFSKWRNAGLKQANCSWILYLDADEVVSQELRKEIDKIMKEGDCSHYAIPRANHFLGKRVLHGDSFPDYQKRLFLKDKITKWQGNLHESPIVIGKLGYLSNPINHFTHRNLSDMFKKTNIWTDLQAKNLYQSRHPLIRSWRLFRMFFTKFFQRYLMQSMYKDGTVGLISSIFESYDTVIIYSKLWELQNANNN